MGIFVEDLPDGNLGARVVLARLLAACKHGTTQHMATDLLRAGGGPDVRGGANALRLSF